MLCFESVGILQLAEIKAIRPEKSVGKLRWHVYEFAGAWDSPLETEVASTIAETWRQAKRDYQEYFDGTGNAKACFHVDVMF